MADSTRRDSGFQVTQVVRSREQVEQQIKDAILRGDFTQSERLPPETGLALQFGVSRPTIREALRALVSAGLIRKMPGVAGGNFVNTVSPESLSVMLSESMDTIVRLGSLDISELTAMRHVLEVPAAARAAERCSEQHVKRLRAVVGRQKATTIHDPEIVNLDRDFHITIAQASGNRLLAAFISAIHDATRPAQYLCVTPEVGRSTVKQHLAIVAAISDGSAEDAAEAMAEHLDYVLRNSTEFQETEQG